MITALLIIDIVFVSTLLHRLGMSSLTKTSPGIDALLRYGSMYVDLPNVALIMELDCLPGPMGVIDIESVSNRERNHTRTSTRALYSVC